MNKLDQLKRLEKEGFKITEYVVVKGKDLTDEFLTKTLADFKASSPFQLDGEVIDVNKESVKARLQAKKTGPSKNPAGAKKYKVGNTFASPKVVDVHWKASKHGLLKPRAEFTPVELNGVTITFATIHNALHVRTMKLGPGAVVKIERAGDVIPKILETLTPAVTTSVPDPLEFGSYTFDGTDYVLDDVAGNDDVKFQRLVSAWTSLGVENVSTSGLEKLYRAGYETVTSIIKEDDDTIYEVVGSRNAYKAKEHVRKLLNPIKIEKLGSVSGAYGRGIGERRLKKVVADHNTFVGLTRAQIETVEGFSEITAQMVLDGEAGFTTFLHEIEGFYTVDNVIAVVAAPINGGKCSGMVIVCTGFRLKGDDLTVFEAAGGVVATRIKKGETTHVVTKDVNSNSGKVKTARDAGIEIISGETLLGII